MGLGGISLWQLLIILVIVVVIFGTRRLGSIGSDLGGAVKGFRKGMEDVAGASDEKLEPDQIADVKESSAKAEESVKNAESNS